MTTAQGHIVTAFEGARASREVRALLGNELLGLLLI